MLLSLKTAGILGGERAPRLDIITVVLFAATMTGMFLTSTLYHAIQHLDAKRILRKFDHSVIFIFIAGTYTPFCLSGLGGAWGWSIFAAQWFLAAVGTTMNILNLEILKKVKLAVYILMGWAIVIGCVPLFRSVPLQSIILLVMGGIAYSAGTIWYRKKNVRHAHAVWHTFVIIGAVCHWFSIWLMF